VSFEQALRAAVAAEIGPLRAEVERLALEVGQLRGALPPNVLGTSEAARRLGISVRTLQRHIKAGTIPVRRIGRRVLIDLADLRALGPADVARLAREARSGAKP
jgi:excisionase family DNA binding protein